MAPVTPSAANWSTTTNLMTSALCVMLDGLEWYTPLPAVWTTPRDPLKDMDGRY